VKVLSSVVQFFDFVNNLGFRFVKIAKSKNLLWFWVFENFPNQRTKEPLVLGF